MFIKETAGLVSPHHFALILAPYLSFRVKLGDLILSDGQDVSLIIGFVLEHRLDHAVIRFCQSFLNIIPKGFINDSISVLTLHFPLRCLRHTGLFAEIIQFRSLYY